MALDKITLLWCLLPYTIGVEQCRGTLFVSYRSIGNQQCMVTKDLLYYYRGQTVYPYTVGPLYYRGRNLWCRMNGLCVCMVPIVL